MTPFNEADDGRKDINTREVIDALKEHLETTVRRELKGHVTWQGLAAGMVGLMGLVFMTVTAFVAPIKESQAQTRQDTKELKTETTAKLDRMENNLEQLAAEVRAVRSVTVDGQPRGRAQEELRRNPNRER